MRILLKLTGELFGTKDNLISLLNTKKVAQEIIELKNKEIELGIVVGGGNIFRGREVGTEKFDKVSADYIGMLATIINGLALQESLKNLGAKAKMLTAIPMSKIGESFTKAKALSYLNKNKIVIFAGGTGNPFFTTDSAAALRSIEVEAEILIKATDVDGIYDSDPKKNPNAKLYKKISYHEVLEKQLRVMDLTAITLCQENSCKIAILNLNKQGNLTKFICGENIGSLVL